METIRTRRRVLLAAGLGFAYALLPAGCGGSSGGAPAQVSPETEKGVQDMLKNKSHDYGERFRKKGRG
jgi:hypothetical protein